MIRSILVELDGDEGPATVVFRPGFAATSACACAAAAAPCPHLRRAREALAHPASLAGTSPSSVPPRSTPVFSTRPPPRDAAAPSAPLADALEVLLEAMLRAAAGELTTAVDEALREATGQLGAFPAPGAARVLARIAAALRGRLAPVEKALAIAALGEAVAALRGEHGEETVAEMLASGAETAQLDELDLVEVARARERTALTWESRLLVETRTGALYREEGLAGHAALSGGPCGRRILATLASISLSLEPPRLRLLHYALEPAAAEESRRKAAGAARRTFTMPEALRAHPLLGVACPAHVWLAPTELALEGGELILVDDAGTHLPFDRARDPGAFEALVEIVEGGDQILAVAGALCVDADGMRLHPWSALVEAKGVTEIVALSV